MPQRSERPGTPTTSRIVGGSTFSGLPAVGALTRYGTPFCTGTLVGKRKVLTAAHCVVNQSAYGLAFAIGPDARQPQASIPIAGLKPHPSYNDYTITNDIALVTLTQDAPVTPMAALPAMNNSFVGEELFFVGYGVSNGYSGSGGGVKRGVWMRVSRVSATTFRYDDPGRNTCSGDSGGPAFYQAQDGTFFVAGVTSYGDANCVSYGVDTRVDAYASFVGTTGATSPTQPTQPTQPSQPQDPCRGETYEGRCNGNTVVWCEDEQVYQQNCASSGKECSYGKSQGYYLCTQPAAPKDPCEGETYEGRCSGTKVIWCEDDTVKTLDCASYGRSCSYSASKGYYGCV